MPGKHVVSVRGTGNLTFGSMSVTITARDTARAVFAPSARAPQVLAPSTSCITMRLWETLP